MLTYVTYARKCLNAARVLAELPERTLRRAGFRLLRAPLSTGAGRSRPLHLVLSRELERRTLFRLVRVLRARVLAPCPGPACPSSFRVI